ncbi:hypothetical protein ABTY20_17970 [Streptomyces sp. NPDC126497]|uniref:hypothetical protein n=1 Tax=Streptomyces sp. NPDC126497 TaxID=3155313 RepID=UPI0033331347
MKSLKAAAVLAGTLIAAGAAAPAYAQESLDLAKTGVDTGLRTAVPFEVQESEKLEADESTLLETTKEAAATMNEAKPVRGDLGLHA